MSTIYLFDVDGTLTPPRQSMHAGFASFFAEFVTRENVFLISGSDYEKIKEQVPLNILNECSGVFGCSGSEYVEQDKMIYTKEHVFPPGLLSLVDHFITESLYDRRFGNHIEHRPGMLNVSVVGRNADLVQRRRYHEWDLARGERTSFASQLVSEFTDYEASCGGEISVDIVPAGWNKSVVKTEVLAKYPGHQLIFFGDRMGPKGNDKPLADVLDTPSKRHKAVSVENYKDTWTHLRHLYDAASPKEAVRLDNLEGLFTAGATFH